MLNNDVCLEMKISLTSRICHHKSTSTIVKEYFIPHIFYCTQLRVSDEHWTKEQLNKSIKSLIQVPSIAHCRGEDAGQDRAGQ